MNRRKFLKDLGFTVPAVVSGEEKPKLKQGEFAELLDNEMKGLMKSLPDDLNRQMVGNTMSSGPGHYSGRLD